MLFVSILLKKVYLSYLQYKVSLVKRNDSFERLKQNRKELMKAYIAERIIQSGALSEAQILDIADMFAGNTKINRNCRVEVAAFNQLKKDKSIEEALALGKRWGWGYELSQHIKLFLLNQTDGMSLKERIDLVQKAEENAGELGIDTVREVFFSDSQGIEELSNSDFFEILRRWSFRETKSTELMKAEITRRFPLETIEQMENSELFTFIEAAHAEYYGEFPEVTRAKEVLDVKKLSFDQQVRYAAIMPYLWSSVAAAANLKELSDKMLVILISKTQSRKAEMTLYKRLKVRFRSPQALIKKARELRHQYVWEVVLEELRSRQLDSKQWMKLARQANHETIWIEAVKEGNFSTEQLLAIGFNTEMDSIWEAILGKL